MPLILGAQSAVDTGFSVDNSCRVDRATGEWMYRAQETPTGTGTKASMSCWIKQGIYMATGGYIKLADFAASSMLALLENAGTISFLALNSSGYVGKKTSNAVLRDPGAWTHVFALWDTTLATAADRMQLWVNGIRITSFLEDTDPTQDSTLDCLDNSVVTRQMVASYAYGGGHYLSGYMSEFAFCDGQAYAATDFGEFNEDSPTIWQPKTISTLTFGDAGWYLNFGDSADMGADVSGNNNDMTTVTNIDATNQGTDTPTNNFCTMNPLASYYAGGTFSEGNNKYVSGGGGNDSFVISTVGVTAGKWYCEVKPKTSTGMALGIVDKEQPDASESLAQTNYGSEYQYDGEARTDGGSSESYGDSYTTDDIVGIYLDLDNNKLYFGKNGTVQASGTGRTITGISAMTAPGVGSQSCYFIGLAKNDGGSTWEVNFGGCSAFTVGSAQQDANGYGNFEYSPSDGGSASFDGSAKDFLAICTKNLGSDGG